MLIARRLLFIPVLVVAFACASVRSGYSLGGEDSGTTKNVAVGSELRLVLAADVDWTLVVRATGDAQCRKNVPPCATLTVRDEFNIRARSSYSLS